jgi:TetR/AcrR family transcriptional regulator, regulator of autoinduction and epiphytic fitness
VDGRVERGARNRRALVSAALELSVEYQRFPTAQEIAERAGVATRSVFHHFPDLDALFAEAAATQAARHWGLLSRPDPKLSLSDRLVLAVAQRAELYERIGPLRRVAVVHQDESPTLQRRLHESRAALRRHLRLALSPEIAGVDRATVAALEAAASWETWEVLRRHQRLSVAAASAAVTTLLTSTLERSVEAAI